MRYVISCFLLITAAAFATPAAAAKYKCDCYKGAKENLEKSDDVNIDCVDTYGDFNSSSSVKESHLKIYVDGDNKIQSDNDARIRFRPRDDKCLLAVYDGNAETIRWAGTYCNNDSYKDIGPFNLDEQPSAKAPDGTPLPTSYTATYKAETSGKHYKGFLLFSKGGDGKKYMQAMCIENR